MPMNNTSHNPLEYTVGKGIVTIKPAGDTVWYDVGNVPEFEFTPTVEELAHFSSRGGLRMRDRTVIIETGGDLRIVLEEMTSLNLGIILLGEETVTAGATVGAPSTHVLEILSKTTFTAAVRFQGMNDVGPKWNLQFHKVDFTPSGSFNPISDEWNAMEVTGRAAAVEIGGVPSFGTARRMSDGTAPGWPA